MRAVVYFETLKGNTREAAENIGGALAAADVEVSVRPIEEIDLDELAAADVAIFGTWVHGLRWFGVGPAGLGKVSSFPVLGGTKAAVFVTYRWNAKRSLDTFADALRARGADVVSGLAIQDGDLGAGVEDFAAGLVVLADA